MASILIIDDNAQYAHILEQSLVVMGYSVTVTNGVEMGLNCFKSKNFDLIICDVFMRPTNGFDFVRRVLELDRAAVVIMVSGSETPETAAEAFRCGAYDYFVKPVDFLRLRESLDHAVTQRRQLLCSLAESGESVVLPVENLEDYYFSCGFSSAVQKLRQSLQCAFETQEPLLIQGEPGCGKNAIAKMLHERRTNPGSPFVCVPVKRCSLQELFRNLLGLECEGGPWMDAAQGGTLFLQGIEYLPWEIQEVFPGLYSSRRNTLNLLVSSALSANDLLSKGKIMDAFFFEFADEFEIQLPPLRDRPEDIPEIFGAILDTIEYGILHEEDLQLGSHALELMQRYSWPNNVRELFGVVAGLASRNQGATIEAMHLPARIRNSMNRPVTSPSVGDGRTTSLASGFQVLNTIVEKEAKRLGLAPSQLCRLLYKEACLSEGIEGEIDDNSEPGEPENVEIFEDLDAPLQVIL